MNGTYDLAELCRSIAGVRLPRWRELPDLELYMDQVLSLVERYFGAYPGHRGLTAAMVNNYVKLGVMPSPVKKKYTRMHLACLIVICVLKASLPIESIRRMLSESMRADGEEAFYDAFCESFEQSVQNAAEAALAQTEREQPPAAPLYHAALRAQAEQALALALYEAVVGEPEKKEKK
ncbi:MAG: DUF1836 domain-containing protein [Oscillospiraceae bacterium]|nr:DUF1836 domain-containing protein [Oscillospiraceae bacterium]